MKTFAFIAAFGATALAMAKQKSYSWTFDPRVAIADATSDPLDPNTTIPGETVIPLPIADSGAVVSIDEVCVDITHTFVSDVVMALFAPNGSSFAILIDGREFGSGDDLIGLYCFETGAPEFSFNPAGTTVPTGTYGPNDARGFGDLVGVEKNGTWSLVILDLVGQDVGSIGSVSIEMTNVPEPTSIGLLGLGAAAMLLRRRG
ncbi:MAG: PEP-CTERM sorting domain-containing protein [Phycisphaerae bacterium]